MIMESWNYYDLTKIFFIIIISFYYYGLNLRISHFLDNIWKQAKHSKYKAQKMIYKSI